MLLKLDKSVCAMYAVCLPDKQNQQQQRQQKYILITQMLQMLRKLKAN